MAFSGKRTDRIDMPPSDEPGFPKQIRIDPEMGMKIRMGAVRGKRSISGEIVHLLETAIESIEAGTGQAQSDSVSVQNLSPAGPVRAGQIQSAKKGAA